MTSVLLVDDDDSNRITLGALIEDEGFELTEAESVNAVREVLKQNDAFELVLLDYHLGDGVGTELIDEIRSHSPAVKVALISGSVEFSDPEAIGIDAVIPKGSDFPVLLESVRNLLKA